MYAATGEYLRGYSIDKQTGTLNPLLGLPIAVGAGADSVTIDRTNQFLYVMNRGAGPATGFELNNATGELTPMPGSPIALGKSVDLFATL